MFRSQSTPQPQLQCRRRRNDRSAVPWRTMVVSLLLLVGTCTAFAPHLTVPSLRTTSTRNSPSSSTKTTTSLSAAARRRDALRWFRQVFLVGGGMATTAASSRRVVQAEPTTTTNSEGGKLVTFQVDNLNGVPGATGSFTVQLKPEWAPRGVERFEVGLRIRSRSFWDTSWRSSHCFSFIHSNLSFFFFPATTGIDLDWILEGLSCLSCVAWFCGPIWHSGRPFHSSHVAIQESQR